MTAVRRYRAALRRLLDDGDDQLDAIDDAGHRVAASIAAGGVLHVFGSGHSMLAAIDATFRAGGLAPVNLLHDPALAPWEPSRVSRVERLPGYGRAVSGLHDLRSGEVLVVVSHSGINPVPIEIAQAASERGLTVVAVTSRCHSVQAPSRHPDGLRLLDVADVVLDTHAPYGDVTVRLGDDLDTGPTSTALAVTILHCVVIAAIEELHRSGTPVPLLRSMNTAGADTDNDAMISPYADRLSRDP